MSQKLECAVKHCQSKNITLFRAPTDAKLLETWKKLLATSEDDFFVCELHFSYKFIEYDKILSKLAFPSILLNEIEDNQSGGCECCHQPFDHNDVQFYIDSPQQEIIAMIFQKSDFGSDFLCARCNEQVLSILRFKNEVEERQQLYKSLVANEFEQKIKLEYDTCDEDTSCYLEPLSSHYIHIKAEIIENDRVADYSTQEPDYELFEPPKRKWNKRQTPKGTRKAAVDYECNFCNEFTANNKKEYAEHIKQYHALNAQPKEKEICDNQTVFKKESVSLTDYGLPVQCDYCGKTFRTKKSLISHIKTHISAKDLHVKCSECEKEFRNALIMSRHRNRFHNDGGSRFWCSCGTQYSDQVELRKCRLIHKKSNEDLKVQCDECELKFATERKLYSHKNKTHGNGKRFWCVRCSSEYSTKEDQTQCVKRHYNDSLKEVLVKCPQCSKEMRHNSLKIHMKSTHSQVRDATCHQCGKSFVSVARLTIHIKQVHSDLKPYQCDHCPLRTAMKKGMREHLMKKHALQRKTYVCPICYKVTFENLDRHMTKVHPNGYDNGVRVDPETNMYHCPQCVQKFAQMKRYEQHIKENICVNYGKSEFANVGEKFSVFAEGKFTCNICGSVQKNLAKLRRHMKFIHSGEMECPACGKKLKSRRSICTHLRKVHKTNFTAIINARNS